MNITNQFITGAAQSKGIVRSENQDAIYVLNCLISEKEDQIPFAILIIADGMGGHKNGDVASRIAVRAVSQFLLKEMYPALMAYKPREMQTTIQEIVETAIKKAHQSVTTHVPGGGTTLTCAIAAGSQLTIGHVGDSRVYRYYPNYSSEQLSTDHSYSSRLQEMGELTKEQAEKYAKKNVLYRALGQQGELQVDISSYTFHQGEILLLCSDGLWNMLTDQEIEDIIYSDTEPVKIADKLMNAANDSGGSDNISVIICKNFI